MNRIVLFVKIFLHVLFKCNFVKTLYLNFKMLPFRVAIKLPIWLYGKVVFRSLSGKIIIDNKIYPGMIRIGRTDWYVSTEVSNTILIINGLLKFKGAINMYHGNYILVSRNGYLELGTNGTFIGSNNKIICFDKIIIGNKVEITWECQLIDTSFHYVDQLNNKEVVPLTKSIFLGDYCWIGNRTTIGKGAYLPNYSIVASNSLINKDFSEYGEYCMFAGIPAKFKVMCKRIYEKESEQYYDLKLNYDRTHL